MPTPIRFSRTQLAPLMKAAVAAVAAALATMLPLAAQAGPKGKHPAPETKQESTAGRGDTWNCEFGNSMQIAGDIAEDERLVMRWKGKDYTLPRQTTVTGAERWFDADSGMDLVIIPNKAMLFNRKIGSRLADECKTLAMRSGATAPTRAERQSAARALAGVADPKD